MGGLFRLIEEENLGDFVSNQILIVDSRTLSEKQIKALIEDIVQYLLENRKLDVRKKTQEIIEIIQGLKQPEEFRLELIACLFIKLDQAREIIEQDRKLEPMFHKAYRDHASYKKKQKHIAQKNRKKNAPSFDVLVAFREKYIADKGKVRGWIKSAATKFNVSSKTITNTIPKNNWK